MHDWRIVGANESVVRGSTHSPGKSPRAVVLFAHGFKGYKDYGFIPVLASELARRLPLIVHRFNFSHSGMGEGTETFEHPELFERDTWNKQVADLRVVADAARRGDLPNTPPNLPMILLGHSRGGVTCLLTAGRAGATLAPSALVTLAAPDSCCRLSSEEQQSLLSRGSMVTRSARTGQDLRVSSDWLQEQLDDPASHDVLACCQRIACPVLAIHGADDPTVDPSSASAIAAACPIGDSLSIAGANHVFNTPNPAAVAMERSAQLRAAIDGAAEFLAPLI